MNKARLIAVFFLLFWVQLLRAAVNSPDVQCVNVLANGDVSITWAVPPDPVSEFVSYGIYSSANLNGPYVLVTTIASYTTTTYTITGAGANSAPVYIYIQTTSTGGIVKAANDTVQSMFLTVTNPANGTAVLQWNPISSPLPAGSSASYTIYREYPAGVWTIKATSTALTYIDTITICSAQLNYYVELTNTSGCTSVSNRAGGMFQDGIPPAKPIIDSVSINASGQAIIGLSPSASGDATCYIIYKHTGATVVAIDTVCGNVATLYTNINSQAGSGVETYDIASIDSCGNVCTHSLSQNTLYLTQQYDLCSRTVNLNWNPYNNMKGGLRGYDVLVSVNGSAFSLAGSTTNTFFTQTGLNGSDTYCYQVRAFNSTGTITSTSNKICVLVRVQSQPKYVYISKVSVNPAQTVDIECIVDSAAHIKGLNVLVATSPTGPFSTFSYIPFTGVSAYTLTDVAVFTSERNYYYKAQVIDSCGFATITSNVSKTILLHVKSDNEFSNSLNWDDYSMFLGNVASYNIYRAVDGAYNPIPIATVPFGTLSYSDNVSGYVDRRGKFSYYVEAMEGAGNPYNLQKTSTSNRLDVYKEEELFIPNAFAPKGANTVFLPVTQYVDKKEYTLMIFNRFGQAIWETEDDTTGWDGANCEGGVYVYLIRYKTANGEYKELKGTVTLLR